MKNITKMLLTLASAAAVTSCGNGSKSADENFKYLIDEFADVKIMRYQIPGWERLSLQQKEYIYHLSEAAKYGWDIYWDQNCKENLAVRKVLQNIVECYEGDRTTKEFGQLMTYIKRVFFSSGIHHHYGEEKFFPECSQEYFRSIMEAVGEGEKCEAILPVIYSPDLYPYRRSSASEGDIVALSSVNFYEGVTRDEVENYYAGIIDLNDPRPISYGLNTKVVKGADGVIREEAWKVGGIYGPALEKICEELEKAKAVAENETQKKEISELQEYYRTGDLKLWDQYNITWVNDTLGIVDFTNGFVEDYNDPLGRKAYWESVVNVKDSAASARTEVLSSNAQWFEDNAPIDPRFKKKSVKGVSAKVIDVTCLGGGCYPATPIGINLPNADWIRKEHGSKSVTIANITHAYDAAANESPKSVLEEFAYSDEEKSMMKKYGAYADEIHTDLHECLGHGSGQLLPGVSTSAMGEYASALEEARADLFGLYYIADPKLVELGIISTEAYKPHYANYIRNGLMTQLTRIELGRKITEAHMQNRQLIAAWCYEQGMKDNVIEKKVKGGKTYFVVNDYEALRVLFGKLLAEIQRIKSEGDYEAGKNLIMKYAVDVDPELHKEVLTRYAALGLKPYGGFVNPDIVPVEKDGKVVDYEVVYPDDYMGQMLEYCHKYSAL